MEDTASSKISNTFWVASAIAIYMVVCAHNTYDNFFLQRITSIFGSIGVPIFLIRSGYYLNRRDSVKKFWSKKLKSIVIPWMVISPCLYTLSIFMNGSALNLCDCILYCIGYGTWLYYVPILLIFYVVFRLLKGNWFVYITIVVFIISNALDVYGINLLSNATTPYLNFFNRIGFFAIGIFLRKESLFERLINNKKLATICCLIVIPIGIPFIWWNTGLLSVMLLIAYRLLFAYVVFVIANIFANTNNILLSVGKDTYLLYFLHMQFGIGLASKLLRAIRIENLYIVFLLKPIIVILCVLLGVYLLRKIIHMFKLDKFAWIIGLKMD